MTELHQAAAAPVRPDPLSAPGGTAPPVHHTADHLSHAHHRPAPHVAPQMAAASATANANAAANPQPAARPAGPPSRVRMAGLVFLFVYPLVTGLLYLVLPLMQGQPIYLTTLLVVPIVVASMVWGIIPFITTRLRHLL